MRALREAFTLRTHRTQRIVREHFAMRKILRKHFACDACDAFVGNGLLVANVRSKSLV